MSRSMAEQNLDLEDGRLDVEASLHGLRNVTSSQDLSTLLLANGQVGLDLFILLQGCYIPDVRLCLPSCKESPGV
jgi:hypothetical protein